MPVVKAKRNDIASLDLQANAQDEAARMRGLADAHETQIKVLVRAFNDSLIGRIR
jgi:hypothetical protein